LHLEDDIILAADALEFCEKHHGKLQPDGQCASLTLLGHRPNTLEQARKVVDVTATIDRLFVCYGVYLRQPVVETIVKNWRGGWSYWDIGITDWYRCWKWKTLVPVLPRARNIGYSPGSPLDKRVHRPIWSGDLVN